MTRGSKFCHHLGGLKQFSETLEHVLRKIPRRPVTSVGALERAQGALESAARLVTGRLGMPTSQSSKEGVYSTNIAIYEAAERLRGPFEGGAAPWVTPKYPRCAKHVPNRTGEKLLVEVAKITEPFAKLSASSLCLDQSEPDFAHVGPSHGRVDYIVKYHVLRAVLRTLNMSRHIKRCPLLAFTMGACRDLSYSVKARDVGASAVPSFHLERTSAAASA